jgi:hypothetical protein
VRGPINAEHFFEILLRPRREIALVTGAGRGLGRVWGLCKCDCAWVPVFTGNPGFRLEFTPLQNGAGMTTFLETVGLWTDTIYECLLGKTSEVMPLDAGPDDDDPHEGLLFC